MSASELYQRVILDHNRNPRNYGELTQFDYFARGFNPICGDRLTVFFSVENRGGNELQEIEAFRSHEILSQMRFISNSCALCRASASIMTEVLTGNPIGKCLNIFQDFMDFIQTEARDEVKEPIGDLKAFSEIYRFPARRKCVSLPWKTFVAALNQHHDVTTEESNYSDQGKGTIK
ncbi:MAG: SUF system NifU family Fe-S cluster assembly protein [Proteobacteria bacterium]|nr:SUF system NifU family Fe-S cluster assembly protein [Pseudomonadota bacterium]